MGWGDELMVTGMAREAQERDSRRRKVRPLYDGNQKTPQEAWQNNPRIARPGEKAATISIAARNGYCRPYIVGKNPEKWTWKAWGPPKGELYFTDEEKEFGARHAGAVIIEPNLKKGASQNKQWGRARWQELASLLAERGRRPTQFKYPGAELLTGTLWVETASMRLAAAVVAHARVAIVPEGGLHHIAAAVDTPAVVIYGGFISPACTGYEDQENFYAESSQYPLGCGFRIRCSHCEKAMAGIVPEDVAAAALRRMR